MGWASPVVGLSGLSCTTGLPLGGALALLFGRPSERASRASERASVSKAGMRRRSTCMGWPQAHFQAGRGGVGVAWAGGAARRCSTCSSRMALALLGCRKPKLRAWRKPLGSTCWSTSQRKSVPASVHSAALLVLNALAQAERQRQATRPGLAVRGTFSPARAWRPAVVARLTQTLGVTFSTAIDSTRARGTA